ALRRSRLHRALHSWAGACVRGRTGNQVLMTGFVVMTEWSDLDALLTDASALMKQGIRLRDESPAAALDCFDRALALRRRLPIDELPVLRYDLAACWLNRAEALERLGEADAAALQSYDEALALLRSLPLDEDSRFVRRLAIAWQNRGRLIASHAPHEAIAAFL